MKNVIIIIIKLFLTLIGFILFGIGDDMGFHPFVKWTLFFVFSIAPWGIKSKKQSSNDA
jgi:hypothetical protein